MEKLIKEMESMPPAQKEQLKAMGEEKGNVPVPSLPICTSLLTIMDRHGS